MEYDIYIESIFFGLYRNWNLEPCLKTGGIVIFGKERPGNLITALGDNNRIIFHVNVNVYTGVESIRNYIKKYEEKEILKIGEFENRIGYRFTILTRKHIKDITGSEGIWFLDRKIKVEECRI